MAVVGGRFAHIPQIDLVKSQRGSSGRVFGFGRIPVGLGATADQVGAAIYPKYKGEWVYAYQSLFPSLDIGSLPPHGTFGQLVAQGVLTRDDVIAGFGVSPTFAAQNPANIDNGIMKTNYDDIGPLDPASFDAFQNDIIASVTAANAAQAAGTGPVVELVNGQNVDGTGTPYPPGDPHYYNELADEIDQYLAGGGTRGVATAGMQTLVKSNPGLVDTLPPDLLSSYAEVFDSVLNPPSPTAQAPAQVPSGATGGGSSSSPTPPAGSSGPSSGARGFNIGANDTGGGLPQPTPLTLAMTTDTTAPAGIPGGMWGVVAIAAIGLAVVAGHKRKRS